MGAPHPDGAKAWLETVGSLEGQVAFNKAKGSIPARTDADPADFSEYQQTAIESFGHDTIVSSLAHGAAAPVAELNAISDATSKFTTGGVDLAGFQSELAAAAEATRADPAHRVTGPVPALAIPGPRRCRVRTARRTTRVGRSDRPTRPLARHDSGGTRAPTDPRWGPPLLLISPSLILVGVFVYGLIGVNFTTSLTDNHTAAQATGQEPVGFVWFHNYLDLLGQRGLPALAEEPPALHRRRSSSAPWSWASCGPGCSTSPCGEGIFRAIYLFPMAVSFIASGVVWRWLLNSDQGERPPA